MTQLSTQSSIGQFVVDQPGRARVLEKLGIDYCCGGKRPLADVCQEKGLNAGDICDQLLGFESDVKNQDRNWNQATLTELCDHLEAVHRVLLREDLPRLIELTTKVANARGDRLPEVREVAATVRDLQTELIDHMAKEETILFPMIRELEATGDLAAGHCGTISAPISVMEMEHDNAGAMLAKLNALTNGYVVTDACCNTHRVMLDSLAKFERVLHEHVHQENNILFPRAQKLAS